MLTEELFSKVAPAKTRLAKRYYSGRGHKFAAAKVRNILNMAKEIHSFLPLTILILRFFTRIPDADKVIKKSVGEDKRRKIKIFLIM